MYRIFNIAQDSQIPVPELSQTGDSIDTKTFTFSLSMNNQSASSRELNCLLMIEISNASVLEILAIMTSGCSMIPYKPRTESRDQLMMWRITPTKEDW